MRFQKQFSTRACLLHALNSIFFSILLFDVCHHDAVSLVALDKRLVAVLLRNRDIVLGFEKLSAFDYYVTEVPSLLEPARLVLRSTNSIPPQIKAYNGKRVSISGFVRPLRTQNRLVTEFLLLRDQGTCCFGSRAQMNHFVRVKLKGGGFSPGLPVPYKATGTLTVGEEYVGEFLTSIYSMDAEKVVPQ